jgi:hypothetical protein
MGIPITIAAAVSSGTLRDEERRFLLTEKGRFWRSLIGPGEGCWRSVALNWENCLEKIADAGVKPNLK